MLTHAENRFHSLKNRGVIRIGNDGFDSWLGLRGIRGIGDQMPVAMSVEFQPVFQNLFPVRVHLSAISSSEQTATLPHLPDAIDAYAFSSFSRPKRWVMMLAGCRFQCTRRSTGSSISQVEVTHYP